MRGAGGNSCSYRDQHIHNLRDFNPEIKHWGDLAIGVAFGSYQEDVLGVSWADWDRDKNSAFMSYIYIKQTHPTFDFNGYEIELWDYSDTYPWR